MNIFRGHPIEEIVGIFIIRNNKTFGKQINSHLVTIKIQLQHGKFLCLLRHSNISKLRIINDGPELCHQWYLVTTYLELCSSKEELSMFFKYVHV